MSVAAAQRPALVLNADYQPMSYHPLSLWSWQDAVRAVFLDRVEVLANYDDEVRSQSFSMRLPSVVSLKSYIVRSRPPVFSRFNVFLRDGFACVYCGSGENLTFDHLVPRSRGGRTRWTNIVTACEPCNLRKGGRVLEETDMRLGGQPVRPTAWQLQRMGRRFPPRYLHETWIDYLYWDVALEE